MKQPIEVDIRNKEDKRRYCNPNNTTVKIGYCSYFECEFSDTCRLYKGRANPSGIFVQAVTRPNIERLL